MARELPIEPPRDETMERFFKQAQSDMDNLTLDSRAKIQLARAYAQACAGSLAVDAARAWNHTPDGYDDEHEGERGHILADASLAVYSATSSLKQAYEEADGCLQELDGDNGGKA